MTQKANVVVALLLLSVPAARCAAATDKSEFNLFNPTPRELMREMSTDRPDTTESPYTVDAGHIQVELSLVDYTYDDDGGAQTSTFSVMPSNVKLGLLNNADIQFVFDPYVNQRIRSGGENETVDGFGGTQVRFKLNLWGNDEGDTAFALMPFVSFPTTSADAFDATDHVEGGLIIPLAIALPHDWGMGLMAEIDFVRDDEDAGYGTQFVHTATIGHDLVGDLAFYVEYIGVASRDLDLGYLAIVGSGLTYGLSPDIQLDGGVNFGISEAADDFNCFVGCSIRH